MEVQGEADGPLGAYPPLALMVQPLSSSPAQLSHSPVGEESDGCDGFAHSISRPEEAPMPPQVANRRPATCRGKVHGDVHLQRDVLVHTDG